MLYAYMPGHAIVSGCAKYYYAHRVFCTRYCI